MPKKPSLKIQGNVLIQPSGVDLTERVVSILEQARANVLRTVNSNMVIAYWLIGREIVAALQGGEVRAGYGDQLIVQLSTQLQATFGRGFSVTNLRYFRTFYTVYGDRVPEIRHIGGGELTQAENRHTQSGVWADLTQAVEQADSELGFSPNLGWSHYRVLMTVEQRNERLFYEIEAEKDGWDVKHLKRQVYTQLFARLLKSSDKAGVITLTREGHSVKLPQDTIKEPYILDFLGLPDAKILHESDMEAAIIDNLQAFLLELGKGFAFVCNSVMICFMSTWFFITAFSSAMC